MPCTCCQGTSAGGSFIKGDNKSYERGETIVKVFERAIKKNRKGDKLNEPALIFENQPKYTFAELAELSTRVAHVLSIELGELLTSNTDNDLIVGYCLFPSPEVILAILSILKLGAGYMCFDVGSTPEKLIRQVGSVRPISILIDENVSIVKRFEAVSKATKLLSINYVLGLALKVQPSRSKLLRAQPHLNVLESPFAIAERVAAIVFTAGSSGYPCAVRISHQSIVNAVKWYVATFPFATDEVSCLATPTDSVPSVVEIFAPLCRLIPLVIIDRQQLAAPMQILQCIHKQNLTRLTLQPAHLNRLLSYIGRNRPKIFLCRGLKFIFTANSTLTLQLATDFFNIVHPKSAAQPGSGDQPLNPAPASKSKKLTIPEIGAPWLVNIYSLAETTGSVSFQILRDMQDLKEKLERNRIPIGRPIFNTLVYVMDETQNVVTVDTIGEICVAGLGVSRGYCGKESHRNFMINASSSSEDCNVLVRTGDYGRIVLCKDGLKRLFFEKRADAEVRVNGNTYDLNKIQHYVTRLELTEECVVVCYNPHLPDQRIVVGVVLKLGVSDKNIDEHLKAYFGGRLVAEVFSIEEVPLQCNGKLDREKFLNKYKDHRITVPPEKWTKIGLPKDNLGFLQEFCEVVAKAMAVSVSHIIDHLQLSFLEMGGDSLNIMAVIASLQRQGLTLKLSEFLHASSMREVLMLLIQRKDIRNTMKFEPCLSCRSMREELFSCVDIIDSVQQEVIDVVSSSYADKSCLCLAAKIPMAAISGLLWEIWDTFLIPGASVVATTRKTGDIAGAILCQEFSPKSRKLNGQKNKMSYLVEFLQHCNHQATQKIKSGNNKVLTVLLLGASSKLNACDIAILLITLIEVAADRGETQGYDVMLIASESPIIRYVCRDPVKYRWVTSALAREFTASDGALPFRRALKHHEVNVYCQYIK